MKPTSIPKLALRILSALLLVGLGVAAASGQAPETHPFSVHDMLAMQRISAPAASPDGSTIAFELRTTDLEANRGRTDLWLVPAGGGEPRQLTTHEAADTSPVWAPDGKSLYFLSSRSGSSQVFALPLLGGEPRQLTDLPLDVGSLLVSPDGKSLAVTLEVFPDCKTLDCTRQRLAEQASQKSSGRAYDRLFVRHWDTWKDGRRSHLFVLHLDKPRAEPVDLTQAFDADVPSKPFGGGEEIAWSSDSRHLVFSARVAGREEAWSTNFDLWAVLADGSAAPRRLTSDNPAWDTQPAFSPDGSILAWLAMARPGYESDRFRVMVAEWRDGTLSQERTLTEAWDRSPSDLAWAAAGDTLYAIAEDLGRQPLFAVDLATGAARELVASATVTSPLPAGERIVFARDDLGSPAELFSVLADGADEQPLTRINAERVAAARTGEYEQFSFGGWDGETVYGYLVKPIDFDPARRYPVAYLIHGGPQGSYGNHFHYRWNPQAYAGRGYAVLMVDFHGSTGYGQAFTDAIHDDWGGKPLEDLQKGLEAALERYAFLDGERVCALGASYGGYMINWIAGKWPDRFRCLVNHAGLFDQRDMYYSTEELWFPEWDHAGPYHENPEAHEKHNPARFVDRWQTPMLVIHGALDFRVPETQGLATFTSLQRLGIPSRLLYFPDENHWVLKPQNSIRWHDEVLAWLDRWLAGEQDGEGAKLTELEEVEVETMPGLYDREWRLEALGPLEAPEPLVEGAQATLRLLADGRIEGKACNRFFGPFERGEEGELSFGNLGATKMACPGPLMELEGRLLQALGSVSGYRMEADRLLLLYDEGRQALRFLAGEDRG